MASLFPDLNMSTAPSPKEESKLASPEYEGVISSSDAYTPLAAQLAPKTFDDYMGQSHLIGPGKPLRRLIESDHVMSMILWGPPGVGKTALARVMARHSRAVWIALNAVMAKVSDVREAISKAQYNKKMGKRTIVFIDEIHRFNKAQQDALLPDVEKGTIILIGATTENPFFAVNGSILSRCQVYELYALDHDDLLRLIRQSLGHPSLAVIRDLSDSMIDTIARYSQGDGRRLVNLLELLATNLEAGVSLTDELLVQILQRKGTLYRDDEHYDIISAFIKSVRGSDANAALYWLARLIRGGEDPRFIARRLLILASEDIGNADSNALTVAVNGLQTVQFIGWPEAKYTLSQVTLYLAKAPKSNQACTAINKALAYVDDGHVHSVPSHLQSPVKPRDPNKPTTPYIYTHDNPNAEQIFWDGDVDFLL